MRDYGVKGQLGLEPTFQEFINKLCDIFDEVKRVLKKDGTCWVNIGDTYSTAHTGGHKSEKSCMGEKQTTAVEFKQVKKTNLQDKCLCQIPSRFAIEMTNRGWILRNELIWHKPNCMPSSVKDRFTVDFEKLFFFTKSKKYYFETQMEKTTADPGKPRKFSKAGNKDRNDTGRIYKPNNSGQRNKRCVWRITTKPFSEAHFAVYPEKLCETPILAGCPENGIILDPFFGAGTTGLVAQKLRRDWIGIELNKKYIEIAEKRLAQKPLF